MWGWGGKNSLKIGKLQGLAADVWFGLWKKWDREFGRDGQGSKWSDGVVSKTKKDDLG